MASRSPYHSDGRATTSTTVSSTRPIILVLDFDGTLTMRDTMHLVAEAGYAHQKASNAVPQPTPWSEIVDAYMADFRAHTNKYKPQASKRIFPEQESAWLSSFEDIERASISRACAAGIFDNVTSTEMEAAGRQAVRDGYVRLRGGWDKLLARVEEHNARTTQPQFSCCIMSVNWSSTFIRGVIRQASEQQQQTNLPALDEHIYANEIPSIQEENDNRQHSASPLIKQHTSIRTSNAKVKLLRSLRNNKDEGDNALLVYVGDSSTDLDCLLEADLGFCIHDDPMGSGQKEMAQTCQRIGIKIVPSTQLEDYSNTRGKSLLSVKDFSQILECLKKNNFL